MHTATLLYSLSHIGHCESESEVTQSCPTLRETHGLQSSRLLCPWDFPGKSTRVGCHFFLQGIFPAQGSNPGLPSCRQTLYRLSHQGSPIIGYQIKFPVLCSGSLSVIYFIYSSVYMSIPISQFISLSSPLVNHKFVFCMCNSIYVL